MPQIKVDLVKSDQAYRPSEKQNVLVIMLDSVPSSHLNSYTPKVVIILGKALGSQFYPNKLEPKEPAGPDMAPPREHQRFDWVPKTCAMPVHQ